MEEFVGQPEYLQTMYLLRDAGLSSPRFVQGLGLAQVQEEQEGEQE